MNYKLTIAYDGTEYHGWQRQKNGITVQEIMEDATQRLFGKKTDVTGCSRTDAGVHAKEYVCSFSGETTIPTDKIHVVLNTFLPEDIRAYSCEEVSGDFNARFCAIKKAYEYKILNASVNDPNLRRSVWHYPIALNLEEMKKAASFLEGKHDFAAFCAAGSVVKSTVRNLYSLSVNKEGDIITIRAEGDGFLYNMVRIIAGTLVYVGNGKLTCGDVREYLLKKDRRLMGITAPPQGLTLVEVTYGKN